MLLVLLCGALAASPPPPPSFTFKTVLLSPKQAEIQASLGTSMVRPMPLIIPSGFIVTNLTVSGGMVTLGWQPGTNSGPFQVQASSLNGTWVNVGAPTAGFTATFPALPQHFFRVSSAVPPPPPGHLNWVTTSTVLPGDTSQVIVGAAQTDSQGRTVIAGTFSYYLTLGGVELESVTTSTAFIARFNKDGSIGLFKKLAVNDLGSVGTGVAIGTSDSIIVSGVIPNFIDFGNGITLTPTTDAQGGHPGDIFVAKFDSSGAIMWANRYGPPNGRGSFSTCSGNVVKVDTSGDIVIAAYIAETVTFGTIILSAGPQSCLAVVKITQDGQTVKWAKVYQGGMSVMRPFAMDLDMTGNLYVSGTCGADSNPGGGPIGTDSFLAKYTGANGNYMMQLGIIGNNGNNGVAVDKSSGVVYWTGNTASAGQSFGNGKTAPASGAFLAKFDPSLVCQWVKSFNPGGGSGNDVGKGVVVDANSFVYCSGTCPTLASLDGAAGFTGAYIGSFKPDGTFRWNKPYSGSGRNVSPPRALTCGTDGTVTGCGTYSQTVDFGGIIQTAPIGCSLSFTANYTR